jgi:hypothetical protein
MVMTFEQEVEFEKLKQLNKIELSALEHKNRLEELDKQIEIARLTGRGV